ncbi:hypothetical protein A1D22_01850 [Pasteurellaceae bacterium LFhippo2]|nr:hypothetical protein [Pasteurellaceae bacterium LFhippo2]
MKILHTADWHLGIQLNGKRRDQEHQQFLDWLVVTIEQQQVNIVVIAGDVFDSTTPSNYSIKQYYDFLYRAAQIQSCRHIIVVGGNHDSPSLLDAPAPLLTALNVQVVGNAKENISDEVFLLSNQNQIELIVCAVPYLRERDVRLSQAGESQTDKNSRLIQGIAQHYQHCYQQAEQLKQQYNVPILATGHLFCTATGSKEPEQGDGVRELYVGSLNRFPADYFPPFDYIALGHLHIPQTLAGEKVARYSGSSIAMGFGEANQQKSITLVEFDAQHKPTINLVDVPIFQQLQTVKGDWDQIIEQLDQLKRSNSEVWLKIRYEGSELIADLREKLDQHLADTKLEILMVENAKLRQRTLSQAEPEEDLASLSHNDVFARCLNAHEVSEEQQTELLALYQIAVQKLNETE